MTNDDEAATRMAPPAPDEVMAMAQAVIDACPSLPGLDSPDAVMTVEACGLAMQLASKWYRDVEEAFKVGKGDIGVPIAAEILAYGALKKMFESLPADDVRRPLHAAGAAIGGFIVDRWRGNARQIAFRLQNPS